MKHRILQIVLFLGLSSSTFAQINFDVYMETCVLRDTLFVDVMIQDNGGTAFALGGANFVFDIIDPTTGAASTSIGWGNQIKIDSADGPWDDSGNGDYFDMGLNSGSFINLTVIPDEDNNLNSGPNTGTTVTSTATRVAKIAIPVLVCGDTVNLVWRTSGFGSGTMSRWGVPGTDIRNPSNFTGLSNILLCNNLCTSQPLQIVQSTDSICFGDNVSFTIPNANAGDSIIWYVNGTVVQRAISDSLTYNVTDNDTIYAELGNNTCANCPKANTNQLILSLLSTDSLFVNAGLDTTIDEGITIILNGSGNGTSFVWTPDSSLSDPTILTPEARPSDTTAFILFAYGQNPICFVSDTVIVNVIPKDYSGLVATNVFTPNGDGKNDNWTVNDPSIIENCKVAIYNRWGVLVFQAEPYLNNWSGNQMDGKPVLGDTYYYTIICKDGFEQVGAIEVVR